MRAIVRFRHLSSVRRRRVTRALGAALLMGAGLAGCSSAGGGSSPLGASPPDVGPSLAPRVASHPTYRPVCPPTGPDQVRCHSEVLSDDDGKPIALPAPTKEALNAAAGAALPNGALGAADLQNIYNVPAHLSPGATVAIVTQWDHPNIAADLAVYRNQYGLPACTVASGCFTRVGQTGTTTYPPQETPNTSNWNIETALDVDMVSAACPSCNILLVEYDGTTNGMELAFDTAASRAATVSLSAGQWMEAYDPSTVSCSTTNPCGKGSCGPSGTCQIACSSAADCGGDVFPGLLNDPSEICVSGFCNIYASDSASAEQGVDAHLNHPGVSIFISSGDYGYYGENYGAPYPASSPYVTAVGGTLVNLVGSMPSSVTETWDESAWGNTGTGCSLYESRPSSQAATIAATNTVDAYCRNRVVTDVAGVAQNVFMYTTSVDSTSQGGGGWFVAAGTSCASPFVAGLYALTGRGGGGPGFSYANKGMFQDITGGANVACPSNISSGFCQAATGYDPMTGNGRPNGYALAGIPASPSTPYLECASGAAYTPDYFTLSQHTSVSGICHAHNVSGVTNVTASFANLPPGVLASASFLGVDSSGPKIQVTFTDGGSAQVNQERTVTVTATPWVGSAPGAALPNGVEVTVGPPCQPITSCGDLCATSISDGCGGTLSCSSTCGTGDVCTSNHCCPTGEIWSSSQLACIVWCPSGESVCPATGTCTTPAICSKLGGGGCTPAQARLHQCS
jgi:hypothetical protein